MGCSPRQTRCSAGSSPRSPAVEDGGALGTASPEQRADAGHQHHEREGLGQEVVRAGIERPGLLLRSGARREHQDRHPVARLAQPCAELVAREPRQHHVEHEGVVLVLGREPLAVRPGQRDVDGVPLVLEPAAYGPRHVLVVLDDQDPHPPRIPPSAEPPLNLR